MHRLSDLSQVSEQGVAQDMSLDVTPLEVEQKYRVASHDPIVRCLVEMQAKELPTERQRDIYFQHPSRDFAATGEAFRVRHSNEQAVVTYKGPRIPGPVKTRAEIELPLADQTAAEWLQLLSLLGFPQVATIFKDRRPFEVTSSAGPIMVALDHVEALGDFVEIEAIVDDRPKLASVQEAILALATQLDLKAVEPRSYLRQWLEGTQ